MDFKDIFSLQDRTALITGSSRSIGRMLALGFAQYGADVAVNYQKNITAAQAVADQAAQFGGRAVTVQGDILEPGAARKIYGETVAALGRVDVLVINAAIQFLEPFTDVSAESFEQQVRANFQSTFELMQLALPDMAQRGWGRVLNIGSSHQAQPMSRFTVYAAMKAAQHNLVMCLAKEYAPHGVTINTLAPGMVETDRHDDRRNADPEAWDKFLTTLNWMKRAADPEEMVGAALMFCSDAGKFITGANLFATGGSHLP